MATLVSSDGEIPPIALRPGINTVGRAEGNHHVIPHHSVSSRHCEIVLKQRSVAVRDLGSTNGTLIDDQPVQQAALGHRQRLRLGDLEFVLDAPELTTPQAGALRVSVPQVNAAVEATPGRTAAEAIAALAPTISDEPGFYQQLPGSFAYPFNKNGLLLLALGTGFFLLLSFGGRLMVFLSVLFDVLYFGYLFTYMQRIISSTANGENELPDFPDFSDFWSDILLPFLLYTWTIVVTWAPFIAMFVWMKDSDYRVPALAITALVCGLYFPMALLVVSVTDSFLALSPHVVLPSILRVPGAYLLTCLILAALAGVQVGVNWGLSKVPVPIVPVVINGFVWLCILVIQMRILGLLFRSHRDRLGWL